MRTKRHNLLGQGMILMNGSILRIAGASRAFPSNQLSVALQVHGTTFLNESLLEHIRPNTNVHFHTNHFLKILQKSDKPSIFVQNKIRSRKIRCGKIRIRKHDVTQKVTMFHSHPSSFTQFSDCIQASDMSGSPSLGLHA